MQVNNVATTAYNSAQDKSRSSVLGKDDFLKLLVTQLRYQDPLNPMEDKEFIAQSAQFSSLEQMANINENFSYFMRMQALSNTASIIGKEVTYLVPATEEGADPLELSGRVTEVKFADGGAYMTINGEDVPLDYLISIKEYTEPVDTGDEGADGTDPVDSGDETEPVDGEDGSTDEGSND